MQGPLRPDLTVLFDLPVEQGLVRAGRRGQADRFESEAPAFFQRVRYAYLDLAAQHPQRYRIVNANCSVAAVQSEVAAILRAFLEAAA